MKKLLSVILLLSLFSGSYAQIYVVGYEFSDYDTTSSTNYYGNVKFWKNGVPHTLFHVETQAYAYDIFVHDSNIYIVGSEMDTVYFNCYYAFLWHNGAMQYLTDSTHWSTARSIVVANGDIYIAGNIQNSSSRQNKHIATLWKNGVAHHFEPDTIHSYSMSVFVEDNNVYVAVNTLHWTSQTRSCWAGTVWKNGEKLFTIGDGATNSCFFYDMYVSNGDVYVAGYVTPENYAGVFQPVIWKNGVPQYLTDSYREDNSYAAAVWVKDSDVYVAGRGYFSSEISTVAVIWKNGVPKPYNAGWINEGGAIDIAVVDNDVYVLTSQGNMGFIWKNDLLIYNFSPENLPYLAVATMFINPDSLPNIGIRQWPRAEQHVKLYPNPATHIVTVELPVDIWQADLQLFDIQGRLIKQETIHHKSVLDVSGLHPGLYLYKAVTGKHNYNGKLLITRQ